MPHPFHLSMPVSDLERAREFYVDLLGCQVGRSSSRRFDLDFFGHHVVAHLAPGDAGQSSSPIGTDDDPSPVRHFGVILPQEQWDAMAERVTAAEVDFVIKPQLVHKGRAAEQSIMLIRDGCGNVVEFKSMPKERIFAKDLAAED